MRAKTAALERVWPNGSIWKATRTLTVA